MLKIKSLFRNPNLGCLKSVLKEPSHGRRFSKLLWGLISLDDLEYNSDPINGVLLIEPLFGNLNLGRLKNVLSKLSRGQRVLNFCGE